MSNKLPIEVTAVTLSELRDGTKCLTISSKTGQFEFSFTPEVWYRLGESARWFEKRLTNGVHKETL